MSRAPLINKIRGVPGRCEPTGSGRSPLGFTLIEVLVVVAIIALLVAILLPTLSKARRQAQTAVCKTNLHDFGLSIRQYLDAHDPYYPLMAYIGASIYNERPWGDDNLFVLWWGKYTGNVDTHVCPGTGHRIRKPERIEKVHVPGKGIRFDIYTGGKIRNDFEFHAQLVREYAQLNAELVDVNGFGTSYEYMGWANMEKPGVTTQIDWYPFPKVKTVPGEPLTERLVKRPSLTPLMKDADEGDDYGPVVGAPPGAGTNNLPESWDNHGTWLANVLYADGHTVSHPRSYWE